MRWDVMGGKSLLLSLSIVLSSRVTVAVEAVEVISGTDEVEFVWPRLFRVELCSLYAVFGLLGQFDRHYVR